MDYIRKIVNRLPADFIANLNIDRMYELIVTMQELCLN